MKGLQSHVYGCQSRAKYPYCSTGLELSSQTFNYWLHFQVDFKELWVAYLLLVDMEISREFEDAFLGPPDCSLNQLL
jgi:hypothetical protein